MELEALLKEQRAAGQFDSEGVFKVDLENARKKVALYGLDSADKGLLKVAQVAVAAGAHSLDIQIGENSVTVQVPPCPTLEQQAKAFEEPLSVALWSCFHSGFKEISVRSPSQQWLLKEDGIVDEGKVGGGFRLVLRRETSKSFWLGLRSKLRSRCADTLALQEGLRFCGIPVTLDRRPINTGMTGSKKRALELFLTGGVETSGLEIACVKDENLTARIKFRHNHRFPGADRGWKSHVVRYKPASAFQFGITGVHWPACSTDKVLAHFLRYEKQTTEGTLTFVQSGVTVGSIPFPFHGACSAAGLDLDASGMSVVQNDKLKRRMEYLKYTLRSDIKFLSKFELPKPAALQMQRVHQEL